MYSSRGRHTTRALFSQSPAFLYGPYSNRHNQQNQRTPPAPSIFLSKFEFSPLKGLLTNRPSALKKMILQQLDRKNLSLELTEDIFVNYMKKYTNKDCDRFSARDAFVAMIDEWTHLRLCEFIYKEKIYYPLSSMDHPQKSNSKVTQKPNHQLLTTFFNTKNLEKHKSIKQLKKELKFKFDCDRYEKDVNMKTNGKNEENEEHKESYKTVVLSFPKDKQLPKITPLDQSEMNVDQSETNVDQSETNTEQHIMPQTSTESKLQNDLPESPNTTTELQNVFTFHDNPLTNAKIEIDQEESSTCDFCKDSVMKYNTVSEPTVLYTDKPTDNDVSLLSVPHDTQNSIKNEVWASISPEEEPFTDPVQQPMETNSTTVPNSTCQIM